MKFFSKKVFRISIITLSICLAGVTYYFYDNYISDYVAEGWDTNIPPYLESEREDEKLKEFFLNKNNKTNYEERYQFLFKYFLKGYLEYQSEGGALVYYPGENSSRGAEMNALEGFARFFPLAASYMFSTYNAPIDMDGKVLTLSFLFKKAIIHGTDPNHKEYWGDIEDRDQRLVEAADVALGLWLSRDYVWETFDPLEKRQVFNWLMTAEDKRFVDNNWNLFPITIFKVLEALGNDIPENVMQSEELYKKYKSHAYKGAGWFYDEPSGYDYYNAWAIHYSLFWLNEIDPNFDPDFIKSSNEEFVEFYKYLFSGEGFPMMGRSVCYRVAAPAPIIAGAVLSPDIIPTGLALNALDSTWKYFILNDGIKDGKVTQGFFKDDLSLLDSYSGAGSCLWSLRSLIVAFYANNKISLFKSEIHPFPIDISSYEKTNDVIEWTISGNKETQKIVLEIEKDRKDTIYPIIKYGLLNKIKEFIFRRPARPNNHKALYENKYYTNENLLFK